MRASVACVLGAAVLAGCAGCRANNCALVESQLRQRDFQLREMKDEVDRCAAYNQALEQELRNLRGDCAGPDAPERGAPAYPVKSLALGRGTGGRDDDGLPGDESLEVHVEPRDPEGNVTKVPGSALIFAAEIGQDGIKRPLSSWEVGRDQLSKSWRSGLLSSGYVLVLPWKVWPSTEKVRVTVQFRLLDGRLFEADKDVTVRVAPPIQHPAPPAASPPPLTEPPGPSVGEETAPIPRSEKKKDGARRPAPADPAVRPAAEILRPVALPAATGGGSWSAPVRTSSPG